MSARVHTSNNGEPPSGIVLNPYLISYPTYEHWRGYVPYVYWQGNPPNEIASRALTLVQQAVDRYYPGVDIRTQQFWMNSTRNFGGHFAPAIVDALRRNGALHFRENDYSLDEAWKLSGEQQSQSELVSGELANGNEFGDLHDGGNPWAD